MKKLLILLLLTLALVSCSQKTNIEPNCQEKGCAINPTNDEQKDHIDTNDINWDVISFDKAYKMVEDKETCLLFLSFVDCPWCKAALPVLQETSNLYSETKTYYVDVAREERVNGEDTYDKFFALAEPFLKELGDDKIYMPTFIFLKDGEIVKYHVGTIDGAKELSEEQTQKLMNIFKEGYELLK